MDRKLKQHLEGVLHFTFWAFPQKFSSFPKFASFTQQKMLHFLNSLLHFPNKWLHFPNKWLHFPNSLMHFPMQCCVILPKKIRTQFYQIFSIVFPYWGQHFLWNVSKEHHSSRHSIRPCLFSGRQFEKTFENTQWRTVEQM